MSPFLYHAELVSPGGGASIHPRRRLEPDLHHHHDPSQIINMSLRLPSHSCQCPFNSSSCVRGTGAALSSPASNTSPDSPRRNSYPGSAAVVAAAAAAAETSVDLV